MLERNWNEFLKKAIETGRVKDVEEAWKDNPVEDEIHQGKVAYFVAEESAEYNIYKTGDIVFVPTYKYENGEKGKNHLFVIIGQNNIAVTIENFGMLISSRLEKLKYNSNKFLEKTEENGLRADSIVKTDVIYKIKNEQILFKIGKVDMEKIEEYRKAFLEEK